MRPVKLWWSSSSWPKRIGVMALATPILGLVLAVIGFWWLLTPTAGIAEYSAYFTNEHASLEPGEIAVTFFGVSTLMIDDGETQLLVDAFFTRPPALRYLFGGIGSDPEQVRQFVADYDMDRLRAVLVSHSHVDHAIDVGPVGELSGATIAGTESTLNVARGAGLPESQLFLAEPGDVMTFGEFTVQVVETSHSVPPRAPAAGEPQLIPEPLQQPAAVGDFAEGGTLDFVITHGDLTMVVKGSANYVPGALDGIEADVLFLGTALLGGQEREFQTAFLNETVGTTTPELVVPLHWDDFMKPWKAGEARFNPRVIDARPADGIDLVLEQVRSQGSDFALLQAGSRMHIRR